MSNYFNKAKQVLLKLLMVAAIFLLVIVAWYLWGQRIEHAPYDVIDTGIWPAEVGPHEPLWLDNERIIVSSTDNHQFGKKPYRYVVYNVKTKKITNTPLVNVGIWCGRDGHFVYSSMDPKNQTIYRGTLGQAKPHPKPNDDWVMDEFFDCDWVPKNTFGLLLRSGQKSKLRNENYHEELEVLPSDTSYRWKKTGKETDTSGGKSYVFTYHQTASSLGIEIPYAWPTYTEYLDAYIVGGHYYDPKQQQDRSFYILQRTGDMTEVYYPRNMLKGRNEVFPVKNGYLVSYIGAGFDYKINGLYLIRNGELNHVLSGFIKYLSVSPNGCFATFSYSKNVNESLGTIKDGVLVSPPKKSVKFINFCKGTQP